MWLGVKVQISVKVPRRSLFSLERCPGTYPTSLKGGFPKMVVPFVGVPLRGFYSIWGNYKRVIPNLGGA